MVERGEESGAGVVQQYPKAEEAFSVRALHRAMVRAMRGHRDDRAVAVFALQQHSELCRLSEELAAGKWKASPYREFLVRDSKPRVVAEVCFADRVVHHALIAAVDPAIEPLLDPNSFACRKGKGLHRCVTLAQCYMNDYSYALGIDIYHYFYEVPHAVLLAILADLGVPNDLLKVFQACLSATPRGGSSVASGRGMCIGALTSQFLGNVGLHPLEQGIRREFPTCDHVRYMDDTAIFGNQKRQLWAVHELLTAVASDSGLRLKAAATRLAPAEEGLSFCGHRIFRGCMLLRRTSRDRLARAIRRTEASRRAGILTDDKAAASIATRLMHASFAGTREWQIELARRLWPA